MRRRHARQLAVCLWIGATVALSAEGATTDLATAPLITSSGVSVLPNVMFVMDDSGSMAWSHMPDTVKDFAGGTGITCSASSSCEYGYRSSHCNGVYYDPNITYEPPVDATGASYPNASFTSAWKNGYKTSEGTVNLSTSFYAFDNTTSYNAGTDKSQPAYYYTYSGKQTTAKLKDYNDTDSVFYKECNSTSNTSTKHDGQKAPKDYFTYVKVTSSSGPGGQDERTNFANWFSYHRTRMLMMKTATGRAFNPIDNRYRVAFMSLNNNNSPAFLNWGAFDSSQKSTWYGKLYGCRASGGTPLREAMANVGRLYARKLTSINNASVNDPIQYSCQQNFLILSTDGYWNGTANSVKKLDGTSVMDNQDGGTPRPHYDGSAGTTVTTTTSTTEAYSTSGCSWGRQKIVATVETTVHTVTTSPDGKVLSDTTTGPSTTTSTVVGCTWSPRALQSPNPQTEISTSSSTSGGSSNSLADGAQYYYMTDLRSSALGNCEGALGADVDVCENNVPSSGTDSSASQHMTTFTLGLGAPGRMIFTSNYTSDTTGDYFAVKSGTLANPPTTCPWQQSGACNWPLPKADEPEAIDDMWHAAVNGRGTYFSATNPASLAVGLASALAGVSARDGTAAAAATSSPNVTAGDNFVFSSLFTTMEWTSELQRQQIDVQTGALSATVDWKARDQLDSKGSRTLYTYNAAGRNLKAFDWASLSSEERDSFSLDNISTLSQFCATGTTCLSETDRALAAGEHLVSFIRGVRTHEGPANDSSKYYRQRTHVLGDLVNSEAVYVKDALYLYGDAGYQSFASGLSRPGMVYVGANDGMLHAFNNEGVAPGSEEWVYVPKIVIPNLFKLADKNYANLHQYYVDGTPVTGDAYFGGAWHTILVGGLNAGGRGYYALDVTNPESPAALWEFTDTNMGYTFGNPVITKLKDGTWVVLLTSGYNNVSPGDGLGRLYVVNVETGTLIRSISTSAGSTDTPSGLAKITAWVDNAEYDNTAQRVYGGDILGNLWRFDVNGDLGNSGYDAQLLATLRDSDGEAQSITTKPEIGEFSGNAVVYVGTGRLLGVTDLPINTTQSMYAIKDQLGASGYGNPRIDPGFVQQTFTEGTCPAGASTVVCNAGETVRIASRHTVDLSAKNGWYVDLPTAGERINTDPLLVLGMLLFNTNVPSQSACTLGGYSFRYFVDAQTGGYITSVSSHVVGQSLGNALATRPVVVQLPSGKLVEIVRLSGGSTITAGLPRAPVQGITRRASWRQLHMDE